MQISNRDATKSKRLGKNEWLARRAPTERSNGEDGGRSGCRWGNRSLRPAIEMRIRRPVEQKIRRGRGAAREWPNRGEKGVGNRRKDSPEEGASARWRKRGCKGTLGCLMKGKRKKRSIPSFIYSQRWQHGQLKKIARGGRTTRKAEGRGAMSRLGFLYLIFTGGGQGCSDCGRICLAIESGLPKKRDHPDFARLG